MAERARQASFKELEKYLEEYKLKRVAVDTDALPRLKPLYKQAYSLMVWRIYIVGDADWGQGAAHADRAKVYAGESVSDVIQSVLLLVQGLYKPARMLIRSAIENVIRMMGAIEGQRVDGIKSVEEVFGVVANTDFYAGRARMVRLLQTARGDYAELSSYVHSADQHMSLVDALRVFPRYDAKEFRATAAKCERTCRVANSLLCYRLGECLWRMDFRHRDDLLESLHVADRRYLHEER